MSKRVLLEHRELWDRKPVLRAIYSDYYARIIAMCTPGRTLEIGGGSGNLKGLLEDVISTDIVPTSWLDAAADAQSLPFADACFANIVMVDVLHHIERPSRFLAEARRVLRPGGRLILLEPAITPVSWVFFKLFHPEPVIMTEDPLVDGPTDRKREPFDANQAIPTLIFGRHRSRFETLFPEFAIVRIERLSLVAYPLSGGFRPWCLIPESAVGAVLALENRVAPVLGGAMGFRLFVVLDRHA